MISKTAKEINPYLKPGYHSDKLMLNKYYKEFGDKLMTGDYDGKWIDMDAESKHINELRKYYKTMSGASHRIKRIPKNIGNEYEVTGAPNKALVKDNLKRDALLGSLMAGLTFLPTTAINAGLALTTRGEKFWPMFKFMTAIAAPMSLGAGAILGGSSAAETLWNSARYTHTPTSVAVARRRSKMSDDELLKLLRGNVIRTEKETASQDYIKAD